jgi:GT2 family glycosyltransferase
MTGGSVSAVIPNWNKADLLARVLADLARQTRPVERIIVIDNASTDASVKVAEAAGASVIHLSRNRGFAYAVNRGIEACATDWVLILNNDVTFEAGWLAKLIATADAGGTWFAAGKLRSASHPYLLDGTFDAVSRAATSWRCGNGRPDGPVWSAVRQIAFAPLTATLVRRELFDRVGLLDESFESYLEDVDFGLRCAGGHYLGVYVPSAVADHAGSGTLGAWHKATVRRIARNQILLVRKHFGGAPRWPVMAGQLLWGLVALRHGAGLAWLRGRVEGRRIEGPPAVQDWSAIRDAVERSESEIRELQKATGYDLYWRLYFAMVRS